MATKTAPKRLVVLDTHALLHRAYHALPDLSSSKGEPTGALYGLISMLLKIVQDLKPDYVVAARDLPGGTHRHDVYEAYKATRVKAEDALISQLEKAPEVFKAFGVPLYEAKGFEADDVVGTIVRQVEERKDIETIIVTGDLDLLQLVTNDHVLAYRLLTGLTDMKLFNQAAIKERYGFDPLHIPDYKGIMGDPSDNIKGVPGVGEGSAKKLIAMFGDLDAIYAVIKKDGVEVVAKQAGVQKRYVQLVADHEEDARFSKSLATIHTQAPITFSLPNEEWVLARSVPQVSDLCDELEFRSLKERVRSLSGAKGETAPTVQRQEVDLETLRETSIALWLLRSDIANPSEDDIVRYARAEHFEDARKKIFGELKETGRLQKVFDTIEKPLMPVVSRMNETGVHLDVGLLGRLATEYRARLEEIAARIYKAAGHEFNVNSPQQLSVVLFDELQLGGKVKKTSTGARTTREAELSKLADQHPIIADVLSYRELQKLLGTYIEKMPGLVANDGRLHAEFLQAGTTTGRMSSQNPNLQNIPVQSEYGRRIRNAFSAPKGRVMISLDYSQIELRIAAGLSGDPSLVGIFKEGGDIHRAVASRVFHVSPEDVDKEMRRRAKVINFGILYGMGVNALRANLGEQVSRQEASDYLDNYFATYQGLAEYLEKTKRDAEKLGYTETLFGRRRYFAGFKSKIPAMRAQAERMALNAPIQGTQSDIIKLAMIEADKLIESKGWRNRVLLVMQVHDELVYEADESCVEDAAREIRDVMEHVAPSDKLSGVPIIAEAGLGPNWGEMEKMAH